MHPVATPHHPAAGHTAALAGPSVVLTLACAVLFMVSVNTTAINTALNAIAGDLMIGSTELAWAVGIYMLACAAFVVSGGRLGDLVGQRRLALGGLAGFVAGALVVASAGGGVQLIAGRLLQGIGAAALMPATMAVVRLVYPPERQGFALGIWGAVGAVGFAMGPLIGGALTDLVGWRWVWWVTVIAGGGFALAALSILRGLPRPAARPRLDLAGTALLAASLFAFVLAVQQGSAWGWLSIPTLGMFTLSLMALGALVPLELRREDPVLHLRLLRNPALIGSALGTGANAMQLIGLLFFFNIYAQASVTLAYSPMIASVALLPFGAAVFVFSLLTGRVCDRFGFRWPIAIGLVLMAIGCGALGMVDLGPGFAALWWGLTLAGVGVGVTFSAPAAAGLRAVRAEVAGEAAGLINVARYLFAALTVAAGTVIFTATGSADLNSVLSQAGIKPAEERILDTTLTGSPAHFASASSALDPAAQEAFRSGAVEGIGGGFQTVMLAMGAGALLSTLLWIVLMRRDGLPRADGG